MELVKPDPIFKDGHLRYTLSSYEMPNVEILIPYVYDEDVEFTLKYMLEEVGGDMSDLEDGEWLRQRFGGIDNEEELREMIRNDLLSHEGRLAVSQKISKSTEALTQRLNERIPDSVLDDARSSLVEDLAEAYETTGRGEPVLIRRMGMTADEFNEMLNERVENDATLNAALIAWADHFQLDVKDEEVARILGVNDVQTRDFMGYMSSTYDWESVRQTARLNLAMEHLAANCNCTYVQETAEQAKARLRVRPKPQEENEETEDCIEHPHLKLV